MRTHDAIAVAVMLALIAGVAVHFLELPRVKYYPLERQWSMETIPDSPGMGWYCGSLWQIGAAALTGTVAWLALRRNARPLRQRWIAALTVLTFLSLAYYVTAVAIHEFHRWMPPPT